VRGGRRLKTGDYSATSKALSNRQWRGKNSMKKQLAKIKEAFDGKVEKQGKQRKSPVLRPGGMRS